MLTRAQPLPSFPADMTNNPERFTLPVIFRSKAAMESSGPDIDLSALMTGKCNTLKLAGSDFTCKSVSYFYTKQGRANFTVFLDDSADDGHVVSFSGANGRKIGEDLYELPIDRMLLNSEDRPKIGGLPVPSVEPSAGICKQLGSFAARQVSSVSCTAMDRSGNQYELKFESDGSPITVTGQKDERVSQSPPTIAQIPTPSKSSVSLPPVIRAATNEEMKDCGAKEIPEAAVTSLDLNGDGLNDYIIDFEKIFENVSGCSCGSAGCPRDFWVSETGSFVKSFSKNIQGIERIENGPQGRSVILGTHGSACNQVGSKTCYFKLTWAGSKAKIEPLDSTAQSQSSATSGSHLGRWYRSDPAVCSNHPDDLNLGLLVYGAKEVRGPDERGCEILKSVSRATKVDLTMRCSVEGTTSAKPEHETLQVVGGKLKLTFKDGQKQRTFTYNRCPAETDSKLRYGSRAGIIAAQNVRVPQYSFVQPDKQFGTVGNWKVSKARFGAGCLAVYGYDDTYNITIGGEVPKKLAIVVEAARKLFTSRLDSEPYVEDVELVIGNWRRGDLAPYGYRGTPGIVAPFDTALSQAFLEAPSLKLTERGSVKLTVPLKQTKEMMEMLSDCFRKQ